MGPATASVRRSTRRSWGAAAAALLVAALAAPGEAPAQGRTHLTMSGGAATYDLSGTGTSWVVGAEVSHALAGRVLLAEAGTRLFSYRSQGESTITHLFPEAGLQLQAPIDGIRPYLGAGAGGSVVVRGRSDTELTLHLALGVRIQPDPGWHLRPELRVRSVDPWTGTVADFSVGVGYRM